jgi:hypothetical protein
MLNKMKTIQAAGIYIKNNAVHSTICSQGMISNHSIIFQASFGNIPRVVLWYSPIEFENVNYHSINGTSSALQINTSDGRDDNVKLCNGIGKCDFSTGQCNCPYV